MYKFTYIGKKCKIKESKLLILKYNLMSIKIKKRSVKKDIF